MKEGLTCIYSYHNEIYTFSIINRWFKDTAFAWKVN